jgi:hypothetical protein
VNKTQLYATIIGVSETIRELGEVPSGHLFNALLMQYPATSASDFQRIIDTLKRARLVEEKSHILRWIGPALSEGEKL